MRSLGLLLFHSGQLSPQMQEVSAGIWCAGIALLFCLLYEGFRVIGLHVMKRFAGFLIFIMGMVAFGGIAEMVMSPSQYLQYLIGPGSLCGLLLGWAFGYSWRRWVDPYVPPVRASKI